MIQTISSFFESKSDLTNCIAITESSDIDFSSNYSTPSFCRSVASGSRTPDVDGGKENKNISFHCYEMIITFSKIIDIDNQENCGQDDEDSPKSAEAILISPIIKSPIKDFEDTNSTTWKLNESFGIACYIDHISRESLLKHNILIDVKDLVIANLSPLRAKKLKAVSVSLFENADMDSDKKYTMQQHSDTVVRNSKADESKTFHGSIVGDINLQEVYAEAKYIKVDEEIAVEQSKSNKFNFRFDEFFIAISGYVFILFVVFTAMFMYRMQGGGMRVEGFCSSCAMEQLQSSFFYSPTMTFLSNSKSIAVNNLQFEPPMDSSNSNRIHNKSFRNAVSSSTEFNTTLKPITSEPASLSTIKILWMHIFFVLKDSQPTSIFHDTVSGTHHTPTTSGGISTMQIHEELKQFQKGIGNSHSGISSGGGNSHENLSSSAALHKVLLSSKLQNQNTSTGSNPVTKNVEEKPLKKNGNHLIKRSNHQKKGSPMRNTLSTTASSEGGRGKAEGGLKRVLNGVKGTVYRAVHGVKTFFRKNVKYTTFLLAMGVYLVFLV